MTTVTRRLTLMSSLTGLAGLAGISSTACGAADIAPAVADSAPRRSYIVQLAEPPVGSYGGGVAGLQATQPAPGQSLDTGNADVVAYTAYLLQKQKAVLATVGVVKAIRHYTFALNGFAAALTEVQADRLRRTAGVVAVQQSEVQHPNDAITAPR